MTDDKKKRGMMAAHLGDIATRILRGPRPENAPAILHAAADVMHVVDYERDYRECLLMLGHEHAAVDAAVAAIERDEWPEDSLAGSALKMYAEANDAAENGLRQNVDRNEAKADTLAAVLEMLGVKP